MTDALDLTVRLAAVGIVISSLETVVDRRAFGDAGPFAAGIFRVLRGVNAPRLLSDSRNLTTLALALLAGAALLATLGSGHAAGRGSLVLVAVSTTVLRWRRVVGSDGAEQLNSIILISATLAFVPVADDWRVGAAVLFIAAQATLAYVTAGTAKLVSPVWRGGLALPAIVNTRIHGTPLAARLLSRHQRLGTLVGWFVILFEVLFVAVYFAPEPLAAGILFAGVSFHAGCAVIMGLNGFLWAFPATYACVWAARDALSG